MFDQGSTLFVAHTDSELMLKIIKSVRKETSAFLDGQTQRGTRIEIPSSDATAPLEGWLHPATSPDAPWLVEFHGGGCCLGDARKEDALCEWIARAFDVNVLGVNYHLAPENPYPAAQQDALAAVRYAVDKAAGADVSLMGYSAGATLSFSAAATLNTQQAGTVSGMLLYYPSFDSLTDPADMGEWDIGLPIELLYAFHNFYLGNADASDPSISPIFTSSEVLATMPRTIMYAVTTDPMHTQATDIGARLRDAGVEAECTLVDNAYHGYVEDMVNQELFTTLNPSSAVQARPAKAALRAEQTLTQGLTTLLGREPTFEQDFITTQR